ncbi:helix-turn-helix domain-containing protein [Paraneptunicella aestuarii]|uniref:helix-turn-helix domain-containing protein n=1 Tax=Paraneptunicella aestuarii TaxID=2831148 RepID=UPI001E4D3B9D|nr:helix-turn-helix domain-containing protein [Paraneptunicella aestuarii]UAA39830.1 helix-turn-helix domain-containing protein [Paraneptunicella aestuarii]
MTKEDFDIHATFERMYKACNVSNDFQLARYLDVTASTVQSWRNAKQPPLKACYKIYMRTGNPIEWLIHGEKSGFGPVSEGSQQAQKNKAICVPEVMFAEAFYNELILGMRMDLLRPTDHSTPENLQMLAKSLYRELNDTLVLPTSKKEKSE